jgi:hypothetical protein
MLAALLEQKRDTILEKWLDLIIGTYSEDSSNFLKKEKDRFHNPVGHTLRQETEVLYNALINGVDTDTLAVSLDNIIKIRSVQDFLPAQAVVFVFLLKNVVREELHDELEQNHLYEQLLDFESKIDGLALAAFDNYMRCKEKIYRIGARESKMRTTKLLERVNRICGGPEQTTENPEGLELDV